MWNPFKAPLPTSLRSSYPAEYGYPSDHYAFPEESVTLDDANYPDNTGIEGSPSQWRSDTGQLFPESHPGYDRPYRPMTQADWTVERAPSAAYSVAPAPGSTDLLAPRDTGGIGGTNTFLGGTGPVTGEDRAHWTGQRAQLHRPNPMYAGPVSGGPDYSSQLAAAYFQQQAAQFSQAYSESAMVSAV